MDSRDAPDMPLPLPLFEGNTPVFSIREGQHRPQGHLPMPGVRCPTCKARGIEQWVLPGKRCPFDSLAKTLAKPPPQVKTKCKLKNAISFARLTQRLNDLAAHDVQTANVELNYELQIHAAISPGVDLEALTNENIEFRNWTEVVVKSKVGTEKAYANVFDPTQGSIICKINDKECDKNDPADRLQWSEVMFQVYQKVAMGSLQPMTELRTTWRHWIVNSSTRHILSEALWFGTSDPLRESDSFVEYRPGDSGFFAILGCQNVSGVVRMLTDHCDAFKKTITCVRVLNPIPPPTAPTFYFVLADYATISLIPTKRPKKSSAGQKRAAKRQKASAREDICGGVFRLGSSYNWLLTSPAWLR
ncbi:MAG: hypothetical protein Q9212_004553 [Teloschistes hypoglaucus]